MIPLLQLIIHFLEALHDYSVIEGSDKSKVFHNRRWHQIDAVIWTIVHLSFAYLAGDIAYLFTGLFIRLFVLQVVLNLLRGYPAKYLGWNGIDLWCRKNVGLKLTLWIKTVLLIASLIYPIIK